MAISIQYFPLRITICLYQLALLILYLCQGSFRQYNDTFSYIFIVENLNNLLYICCAVNVPLPLTDTVQLPVNGPCQSGYLAKSVICSKVLSFYIPLYYCVAVFPRLYPNTTYMPNTDYTDYTGNRVVLTICTDNVNAICPTTISSNIQLRYCIAVFPRLYPNTTYMPNTYYTDYTDYGVVFSIWTDNVNGPLAALNWNPPLPVSGGYFLVVRAQLDWIKVGQEGRQEDHQEGYFDDRYLENAIIYPQTLSMDKYPEYNSGELYTILITYPPKIQ